MIMRPTTRRARADSDSRWMESIQRRSVQRRHDDHSRPEANNLLWRFAARHVAGGAPTVHPDESMVYVGGTDGFYGVNSDGTFGWYLLRFTDKCRGE